MLHGLNRQFLYSAFKIIVNFKNMDGKEYVNGGTCFFLQSSKGIQWLVTNRHVLEYSYDKKKSVERIYHKDTIVTKIHLRGWMRNTGSNSLELCNADISAQEIFFHHNIDNDIACLKQPYIIPDRAGFVNDYFIPYTFVATKGVFENSIDPCDFVAFPGYPEWHDTNERPIMRVGTIASDPSSNYLYGNVKGDCLAYEAFSSGGSSGSPVFAMQKGLRGSATIESPGFREVYFVGVNAGHLLTNDGMQHHSNISYFYKSYAIADIVDNN